MTSVEAQPALIQWLITALSQFEEFDKELQRINGVRCLCAGIFPTDILFRKIGDPMEITTLYGKAVSLLTDGWMYKALAALVFLLLQPHVMLFSAFTVLVFMDLSTKFIALSAGWLIETGKFVKPSLFDSIRGIAQAHRDRIINSHTMRTQFAEKLIVYLVLVFCGCFVDRLAGHSSMAQLAMAYLAGVEFLSIIENLDDAGISAVHNLAVLVKRKGNL